MNRKLWTLFIQRHLQNKPKIYFWLKITPLLIFYPFTLMSLDTHRIWQINSTWNRATVSTTYWSLCASSFLAWILVFLVSFSNFSQTLSMLWNNCNFSDCWKFVTQMSIDWTSGVGHFATVFAVFTHHCMPCTWESVYTCYRLTVTLVHLKL